MCIELSTAIAKGQFRIANGVVYIGNKSPALKYCPYCGKPLNLAN